MSERDETGGKSDRQPGEGVRIIKAEEAQAALEAGEAAGRRPDDQLRFGDVPPVPSGPRPAHRFPLPDSVDPAEAVELPPLVTPRRPDPSPVWKPPPPPEPPGPPERSEDWRAVSGDDPRSWPRAAEPEAGRDPSGDPTRIVPAPPLPEEPPPSRGGSIFDASRSTWSPEPPPEPPLPEYPAVGEGRTIREGPAVGEGPAIGEGRTAGEVREMPDYHPETNYQPDKEPPYMETSWRSNPAPAFEGGDDRTTELSVPEEGITVSAGPPDMPHWADPPTGEVPRLRLEDDPGDGEDDLEAWKALGSRGARWRHEDDWEDSDELSDLAAEEPLGALDSTRTEHSDLYSFDEDFERVTSRTGSNPVVDLTGGEDLDEPYEPRPARPRQRPSRSSGRGRAGRAPGGPADFDDEMEELPVAAQVGAGSHRGAPRRAASRPPGGTHRAERGGPSRTGAHGGDLTGRVGVGAGLVVLLIIAYAVGPKALVTLTAIILVAAAAEAYSMVRAAGFRPATLLGLVATAGCTLAAYWKGPSAIGVVAVFLFVGAMLWYVMGIVEARPLANVAVTVMVFVWVAVLGSFAAVMLAQPHGKGEFLGAIVVAVVADICAFGVGRWIGSRPLASHISPNKTVEGFAGGLIGAIIAGAIIGKELAPWGGMKHGLALGVVIGLLAPVGDLFESVIKRDLGMKDSGSLLAGHGGLLDRFDGVLIALPAAFFVITFFKL